MVGSGLFSNQGPRKPHLIRGSGGVAREVADLRDDTTSALASLAAVTVEEFTNPAAADDDGLEVATATQATVRTVTSFLALGLAALAAFPRTISFKTAGTTPADAPATAVITGVDKNGDALTETVNVGQTATTVYSTKCFAGLTSIAYAAGDGTDATVAIGFGPTLGLSVAPKTRAGMPGIVAEIAAGARVTNGVFATATASPPNGSYTPNTAPNGTNDYCVYFEYDPTA